jgi:hypothetical protein
MSPQIRGSRAELGVPGAHRCFLPYTYTLRTEEGFSWVSIWVFRPKRTEYLLYTHTKRDTTLVIKPPAKSPAFKGRLVLTSSVAQFLIALNRLIARKGKVTLPSAAGPRVRRVSRIFFDHRIDVSFIYCCQGIQGIKAFVDDSFRSIDVEPAPD